jgi:hypothetical protein
LLQELLLKTRVLCCCGEPFTPGGLNALRAYRAVFLMHWLTSI